MINNYDQEFGPGGVYAWPADRDVAESFIEAAPYAKSGADCLNDDFFYRSLDYLDAYLFYDDPWDQASELAEEAAKSRQELFKDARNWPVPYLVMSATYKILSAMDERVYTITSFWDCFLWLFLSFDEPLFNMLQTKGWGKIYKNKIREGFKSQLRVEIHGRLGVSIGHLLVWSSDKEKPWFTCKGFTSHIYPENVLRCLDLVGIDPGRAHSAVDQVFKLQSLTPFYDVLFDNPSLIPAIPVNVRDDEEESKKSSPDLRIHLFKFAYGALLFAGAAMAFTRFRPSLRSPRSNWPSIALVQKEPAPCFATLNRMRRMEQRQPVSEGPERSLDITASGSQQSRSRPMVAAMKNTALLPNRSVKANLDKLKLSRRERIFRQNTIKRWNLVSALPSQSSTLPSVDTAEQQSPLIKDKSVLQELYHQLSAKTRELLAKYIKDDKYIQNVKKGKTWVDGRRILTNDSPEVKDFLTKLKAQGKEFPEKALLCFHAQRPKRGARPSLMTEGIVFTTQGTVTECKAQKDVMNWAADCLLIDNERVKAGDSHENDHVVVSPVANIFELRDPAAEKDDALTVKLPKKIHALRTNYYARNPLRFRFDLTNFNQSLSQLLKPLQDADRAVWGSEEHEGSILDAQLTPHVVVKQYDQGFKDQVGRMIYHLKDDMGFHPRQATAFVVDAMLNASIELSLKRFNSSKLTLPKLEDQSVLNKLTPFQTSSARRCYMEKVRLFNLSRLSKYFSDYIKLANCLELYSQSSKEAEGRTEDGNQPQTEQHRETKMTAIGGFEKALKKGFRAGLREGKVSKTLVETEVDAMLSLANVDRDGNSKEGPLPIEEVKDSLCTLGEELKINDLYKIQSAFAMKKPAVEDDKELYEQCVQSVVRVPKGASTSSNQEFPRSSHQEFSDQKYHFL